MKAEEKDYRMLSAAVSSTDSKKRKGLTFFFFVTLSFIFHIAVMAAVIYGVKGAGDSSRIITLEITFVEESITSPTPSPSEKQQTKPEPVKKQDNSEIKMAMNDISAPVPSPKTPQSDKNKKNEKESMPMRGTSQSSVIPLIKDIEKRIQVSPQYPNLAIRRGYEGTVIIHALVNRKGSIDRMKVVSSSGFDILDEAATKAVGQWEFDMQSPLYPKIWVEVPIRFVLNEANK